jgi:hypothetical protein
MSAATEESADASRRGSAERLSVYLNDHLAGSANGVELAKRTRKENIGTPLGDWLDRLTRELQEDRATLEGLMNKLGARQKHIEISGAVIAERIGRLKVNGQLIGYSPLSPVVELDALHLSINGKLDMWKVLRQSLKGRVDGIDFDEMIRRAERQDEGLEPHRLEMAAKALS